MALKSLDTATAFGTLVQLARTGCAELPHLDSPVQAAADKVLATWREGNAVNAILVSIGTFQSFHKMTGSNVPHTDTLVKRSGCHQLAVGRNCDGGDAVFYTQRQDICLCFDIP